MGAAASGHSTLGIPKSVGKEFIAADPGGKLPTKVKNGRSERMYGKKRVVKGYAEGGEVQSENHVDMPTELTAAEMRRYKNMPTKETEYKNVGSSADDIGKARGGKINQVKAPAGLRLYGKPKALGLKSGGTIKEVAGKPIGKDDGLIPAQRGEFVVRKSAVRKLGTAVLNQVNKGHLPGGAHGKA